MRKLLKKAANRCNTLAGVSLARTFLYKVEKANEGLGGDPKTGPNVSWNVLAEEAGALSEIGFFEPKDGVVRFQRGDVCYLASLDGRRAHYSWVQRSGLHPITEAGVSVPVGNGALWIYHCRTAEWARGRRIYPATLRRIVNDHFAKGYSTAWIYTSKENIASQKGILQAGFGLVATLRALRVGSRYFRLGKADQGD